jgi:hypothetical protein
MKMITFSLFIVGMLCLAAGCANSATRYSMDPGEGVYTFAHETTKDQASVFYLAEEWMASNISNANEAITMRSPESGTLVANLSKRVYVVGAPFWMTYTVRVSCDENKISTRFTTGTLENGTYPPKPAMPGLEEDFRLLSLGLHKYVEDN